MIMFTQEIMMKLIMEDDNLADDNSDVHIIFCSKFKDTIHYTCIIKEI